MNALLAALLLGLGAAPPRPSPLGVLREVLQAVTGLGGDLLQAGDFEGPVRARRVRYRFLTAEEVKGRLRRRQGVWEVTITSARFAGGELTGNVLYRRDEKGRSVVELELAVKDARLARITRAAGMKEYTGRLRGRLKLRVVGGALAGISGEGSLYVDEARLARVPVVAQIVAIMGAPSLRKTAIDRAEAHFTLTPRGVVFQSLEFRSQDGSLSLRAERNGVARYDGRLRLAILPVVDARILAGLKLAGELASEVLRALERRVARVIVEGTVREPRISWNPTR